MDDDVIMNNSISQALISLNFIPVSVCVALGTPYGAYYLAPLLSLSYLFTLTFVVAWPALPPRPTSGGWAFVETVISRVI